MDFDIFAGTPPCFYSLVNTTGVNPRRGAFSYGRGTRVKRSGDVHSAECPIDLIFPG